MVAVDPFAVAEQLANKPDPFALAQYYTRCRPLARPLARAGVGFGSTRSWGGEKFLGGLGSAQLLVPDLAELRMWSSRLFTENIYARGLIRRLITNEINTGLNLQAEPIAELIDGLDDEGADDWAENVENRFGIYARDPRLCDYEGRRNFAELQIEARREALVEGDILNTLFIDRATGLPQLKLTAGSQVVTPLKRDPDTAGRNIIDGVELDERGRQIAYWVQQGPRLEDVRRVAAIGPRSGRRIAWLMYGSDRRMNAVRGVPLLGLLLQSLKELDRYRDSEQRAATVNAMIAMFIQKDQDLPGTHPYSAGAVRNTVLETANNDGTPRDFRVTEAIPGVVMEELQYGEKPVSFENVRPNVNYGVFEASIVHAIAWATEVPPEILTLEFSSNYSASKAAVNEFKAYLAKMRSEFGASFCRPIYMEWLAGEVNADRIQAPGYLAARRNPLLYNELGAWTNATWAGPMKPSVDLGKDVEAYIKATEVNGISMTRMSEDLFGVRFTRVLKRIKREKRLVAEMNKELGIEPVPATTATRQPGATPSNPEPNISAQERGIWPVH